jgi:BASS family bile acid:Na+ symporter
MNVIDLLISGVLSFIMLSVGLSLAERNFYYTFSRPRSFLTGIFLQIIVLPLLAFTVASLSGLPPAFQVGMMVLAACPGGMTSNFISYLLHANTALAISLTVGNSMIALFSIPIVVNFALDQFMPGTSGITHLPFSATTGRILLIVLLPVLIGILIRRWLPLFADRARLALRWVTVILLGLLFVIKLFASENQGGSGITLSEVYQILPFSVLVNFLALSAGLLVGRLAKRNRDDQLTLGVEIGIQNTSLAFLIAATLLGNEDMLKPALVYAMFTFFTAFAYGLLLKPKAWSRLKKDFSPKRAE